MSRERQTKKEMFEFSTKSSESLTLNDIARQTVPQPRSSSIFYCMTYFRRQSPTTVSGVV